MLSSLDALGMAVLGKLTLIPFFIISAMSFWKVGQNIPAQIMRLQSGHIIISRVGRTSLFLYRCVFAKLCSFARRRVCNCSGLGCSRLSFCRSNRICRGMVVVLVGVLFVAWVISIRRSRRFVLLFLVCIFVGVWF